MRPSAAGSVRPALHEIFWEHSPHLGAHFLLGIEFSDGQRVTNLRSDADDVVLHQCGEGDTSMDQSWWLSPLPPDGPLQIVVRCDPLGLPETVTSLDGTAVRAAAADVVELWPWETAAGLPDATATAAAGAASRQLVRVPLIDRRDGAGARRICRWTSSG